MNIGYEEGDICGREGCVGKIAIRPPENCRCHISPPCSECTSNRNYCPDCGWEGSDDDDDSQQLKYGNSEPVVFEKRTPDPDKINYECFSHTHFSMIKTGTYPATASRKDVYDVVKGTFGGRFDYFGDGKFKFIAYTD